MIYVFLVSLVIVLYVYLGYPIVLWVAMVFATKPVRKRDISPSVTIFVSVYNEEKNIETRINNLLELDYPREKMEIVVGSDGSTDKTCEILTRYSEEKKIRCVILSDRRGKPAMINAMAQEATGEIFVFTDARQRFEKGVVKEMMRCFGDPEVGVVSGELIIEDKETGAGKGIGIYWEYEKTLRRMESAIGSILGATGAIYGIRKRIFINLPENVILDDLYTPMNAIIRGHRAIFEPQARAFDVVSESMEKEFSRKVRTLIGNFQIFGMFKGLFNVTKSPIALQLISHKFMRLLVPYFLALVFLSNLFVLNKGKFFILALVLQAVFYALAFIGGKIEKSGVSLHGIARFALIPYEFCVLNLAAVVALRKYLRGEIEVRWEK